VNTTGNGRIAKSVVVRGICEHNRLRSACKECGGSQICEHGRKRSRCKECGGSQICEHNRYRPNCSVCGPVSVYKNYKRGAEKRGHSFLITLDEFKTITSEPCLYCGESEQPRGIDRWDNKTAMSCRTAERVAHRAICLKVKRPGRIFWSTA
jgi:hypothetical protein